MDGQPRSGSVEVICGSMFSGKTEEMIRRVRRARIAKQHVQVFKPAIDTRYGRTTVWGTTRSQHRARLKFLTASRQILT